MSARVPALTDVTNVDVASWVASSERITRGHAMGPVWRDRFALLAQLLERADRRSSDATRREDQVRRERDDTRQLAEALRDELQETSTEASRLRAELDELHRLAAEHQRAADYWRGRADAGADLDPDPQDRRSKPEPKLHTGGTIGPDAAGIHPYAWGEGGLSSVGGPAYRRFPWERRP